MNFWCKDICKFTRIFISWYISSACVILAAEDLVPCFVYPVGDPWRIRITPPGEAAEEQKMLITLLETRAWLRPISRGNRHFTVGGGRLRQSGPRPEARLLRQPALEGLTRSARTDSPRQVGQNKFRRSKAVAAAAQGSGGGGGF
ncbi:flavonoid 3'-monooxygenase-like [Dorcoceras hygrometricum]|uniref:Flavonoid 3'-monooxygenase-like n=1 Tax=Dorcoceras hygrometricum TaxID=472368 RepID=A0A2Z7DAL1_9LAMI|nr:flavonoid 3'-monooxygenase-like [Dorcoceras hygrometricum]